MYSKFAMLALSLLFLLVVSGCKGDPDDPPPIEQPAGLEPVRVFVLNPDHFNRNYGNMFRSAHPEQPLQLIAYEEAVKQNDIDLFYSLLEEHAPDVLVLDKQLFQDVAGRRLLDELDSWLLLDDSVKESDFVGPVIDFFRDKGGGRLTGLTPTFISSALFFNVDLFDQFDVPYPYEDMTWEEVMELARKFSSSSDVYGYEHPGGSRFSPMYMMNAILQTQGLSYWRADARHAVREEPAFYHLMNEVASGYRNRHFYFPEEEGESNIRSSSPSGAFAQGRAAMTLQNYYFLRTLENITFNSSLSINWDTVSEPVAGVNQRESYSYLFDEIFAIYAYSRRKEAAWSLIQYIHGEPMARIISASTNAGGFSSRTGYLYDKWGKSMAAFARLSVKEQPVNYHSEVSRTEMMAVIQNERSVEEAWDAIAAEVERIWAAEGMR